jgi:hypothetical protein
MRSAIEGRREINRRRASVAADFARACSAILLVLSCPFPAKAQAQGPLSPDAATPPVEPPPASSDAISPAPTLPDAAKETIAPPAPPQSPVSPPPSAVKPESRPVEISGEPGKGITFKAGDRFSLNVRSRIQVRYQLHVPPADAVGSRNADQLVNIGTARLWLSGHVLQPELTYMIQLAVAGRDFREGAVSPIFDAYLDWKAHRDLAVRAGQYFVPFDRLRTVREFALQMADRPKPVSELTLDRDVGLTFYSDRFLGDSSPVAWRLGAFGGSGTNLSEGKNPGVLLVGRVELRPLGAIDDDSEGDLERRPKPALALGAGFAGNWNTNRLRGTTGPTFSGGTTDYRQAAADLVFKWIGFALQGEYLWKRASNDRIVSTNPDGTPRTEYTRSAQGWIFQASYLFDPPLEVVGRLSRMYAFRGTDPRFVAELDRGGQELAAGLNYYVNGHRFKLQADWVARTPPDFDIGRADHLVHVQLDATF